MTPAPPEADPALSADRAGPQGPELPEPFPAAGPLLKDPLWAKLLIAVGAVVVLLAGGATAGLWWLADRVDGSVNTAQLLDPDARGGQGRGGSVDGPLNYLLVDSDIRNDSPTDDTERSDTIIIAHVSRSLDRAYLISVPRDLRVEIPPFTRTDFAGSTEKINSAFGYGNGGAGGVQLLSATLYELMGIRFDGAAVIDFDGFKEVVKILGGVDMCIDERTESHHIGYDENGEFLAPWTGPDGGIRVPESEPYVYEVGCRRLKDWEALDYIRQRKSIPDGDYGRQRHQQQFLRALVDEARRQNITTDPSKLTKLIDAAGSSLTVDTNGVRLTDLMIGLSGIQPNALVGVKIPSAPEDIGGVSYVIADEAAAESLYQAIRDDSLDQWAAGNPSWVNAL